MTKTKTNKKKGTHENHLQGEVILVIVNGNAKADRTNVGEGQRILIVALLSG
jgi:hypothetical protein